MRPLQGELLLEAWDRGASQGALNRALTLLAVACRDREWSQLAELPLPERDIELLRLRRLTFGDSLRGYMACPLCAARLEFDTEVSSILSQLERMRHPEVSTRRTGDLTLTMRTANSRDLAAAASHPDLEASRRALLQRCISVLPGADGATPDYSFHDIEAEVMRQFDELHQGAEILFVAPCAACGQSATVDLDIGRFLWSEVRHAALMLLRDVHELASAYGWAEVSILAMSPARRSVYLEMARQ